MSVDPGRLAAGAQACAERRFDQALALLAPPPGETEDAHAPGGPEAQVLRARALLGLDRRRAAAELVAPLLERPQPGSAAPKLAPVTLCEARALHARTMLRGWAPCDLVIAETRATMTAARRLGAPARVAALEAVTDGALAFARMRCRASAERELAEARSAFGDDARLAAASAAVQLEFDDRAAARASYLGAAALGTDVVGGGARITALGLSWIAHLMGEFAEGHARLDSLGQVPAADLAVHRQRLALLAADERWADAITMIDHLLAVSPRADAARGWRLRRAGALLELGQRDAALAAYAQLEAEPAAEGDPVTAQARRTLQALSRPKSPERRRHRLREFPTVAQLRDHCGPASCELYLRYFGIPASQVEIARQIKLPGGGTPVYAMRRFLEGAGLEVRRIEASLPVIRRVLDIGLPLILEEEYSTSRHVAVCIGYDDEREIIEVQDPMTHELRETPYAELPKLLGLANHGALIGLPASDLVRRAALDAARITEARYIALTDAAFAAKEVDNDPAKGDALVDQAIELRRDYELAWIYRFGRARDAWHKEPGPDTRARLGKILTEILALWPDDEWPQQYAGFVYYSEDRQDEARAAFDQAIQRDPGDGNNWASLADCYIALGRRDDARHALEQALLRLPWHERAAENLADLYEDIGELARAWALNDAARERGPKNPFNFEVEARLHERRGDLPAVLAAYTRATEAAPSRVWANLQRARTLARLGRADEVEAVLEPILRAQPADAGLRVELADMLYKYGRPERAMAICQQLLEKDGKHASAFAIMGACQCALPGLLDAGLVTLKLALTLRPGYAWVYAEMGRHLEAAGRIHEAVAALAAATGLVSSANNRFALGSALVSAGALGDGVAQLVSAARAAALDEDKLVRVASAVMQQDGLGAATSLLRDLAAGRDDDAAVLRAHVRLLVEVAAQPMLAGPLIGRLGELEPEGPVVGAWRARARLGSDQTAEPWLREAAAPAPAGAEDAPSATRPPRLMARVLLADGLNQLGRHAEALQLLGDGKQTFAVMRQRVLAELGSGNLAGAKQLLDGWATAGPGRRDESWELGYLVARRQGDHAGALDLAGKLAAASGEHEEDGQLGRWELEKFECMLRAGELPRAEKFGLRQVGRVEDAVRLAEVALSAGAAPLARTLAEHARELDPGGGLWAGVLARASSATV